MNEEMRSDVTPSGYPWRQFVILVVAGVLGSLAVLPYMLAVVPPPDGRPAPPMVLLILSSLINATGQMVIAVGIGLAAARAVGLRAPISQALAEGLDLRTAIRQIDVPRAVILGVVTSVAIIALDLTVFRDAAAAFAHTGTANPPRLVGLLASFEGGITEEILLRLFVMSAVAWLLTRIWRHRPPAVFWVANLVAAVLFGLGHLPATAALVPLTPMIVTRAIVLNGLAGVVAGWLYWRRGLESAMVAHFSADIVLHAIIG
jgi:hypothetical protein